MVLFHLDMREEVGLVSHLRGLQVNLVWQTDKFQNSASGSCVKISRCGPNECEDGHIGPDESNTILNAKNGPLGPAKLAIIDYMGHYVRLESFGKGNVTVCRYSNNVGVSQVFYLAKSDFGQEEIDMMKEGVKIKCDSAPAVFNAFIDPADEKMFQLRAFNHEYLSTSTGLPTIMTDYDLISQKKTAFSEGYTASQWWVSAIKGKPKCNRR